MIPLAELPIHLIGHSRGGSLVYALAGLLGEKGVWVDQVTTLDPHPLIIPGDLGNPDCGGGPYDSIPLVYENILFADNYYQANGNSIFDP